MKAEIKDVWVCDGGCEHRVVGKPDKAHGCHHGGGWFCCENHSDKCDWHMCRETEKWLAGTS